MHIARLYMHTKDQADFPDLRWFSASCLSLFLRLLPVNFSSYSRCFSFRFFFTLNRAFISFVPTFLFFSPFFFYLIAVIYSAYLLRFFCWQRKTRRTAIPSRAKLFRKSSGSSHDRGKSWWPFTFAHFLCFALVPFRGRWKIHFYLLLTWFSTVERIRIHKSGRSEIDGFYSLRPVCMPVHHRRSPMQFYQWFGFPNMLISRNSRARVKAVNNLWSFRRW